MIGGRLPDELANFDVTPGYGHLDVGRPQPKEHLAGRLKVLSLEPDLDSLQYSAVFDPKLASMIAQSIAATAAECSSFDR